MDHKVFGQGAERERYGTVEKMQIRDALAEYYGIRKRGYKNENDTPRHFAEIERQGRVLDKLEATPQTPENWKKACEAAELCYGGINSLNLLAEKAKNKINSMDCNGGLDRGWEGWQGMTDLANGIFPQIESLKNILDDGTDVYNLRWLAEKARSLASDCRGMADQAKNGNGKTQLTLQKRSLLIDFGEVESLIRVVEENILDLKKNLAGN